ncbi:MAG: insulinase family protein [Ruminococcus flavefaciens]|nr:insulinase family protein [Ruminococcus flavefaciens]MCM1230448.1 insulinase family protein [Ruminococcus flavefaciens]
MNKEIITSRLTGDSCIHVKHPSGLNIYIREMPGFSNVHALFGTRYGSINTMFRTAGDEDYTTVPEGIAHFLEHKLFENEECGVFELYAKTGASGNAFTSFDKTCYLFSCSKNYAENLRILLDFVQKPYFTKENVEKEQGIIGQEIQMTNDNPEWRLFFNTLKSLYHNHPVKIDIAGTVESIAKIDADLLYKCYNTFYNLNNMVLSIAGNINADEVLAICDELLKPCEDNGLETVFPNEPETIVRAEIREKQPVGATLFQLSYKCRPLSDKKEQTKKYITALLITSLLVCKSNKMYAQLMNDGIINNTFDGEIFDGDGYMAMIFSGESEQPDVVRQALINEMNRIVSEGVCEKDFQRIKKSSYGALIRQLNNVSSVAGMMINNALSEIGTFDIIDMFSEITSNDVYELIKSDITEDKLVMSVIEKAGD